MGCNCSGRSAQPRPMTSLAQDGRRVEWWVGDTSYETIAEAKKVSDATGEPIRRVFAS